MTTSPTSQVIDVGTVTFTVYDGTEQIGSSTTPEAGVQRVGHGDLHPPGR